MRWLHAVITIGIGGGCGPTVTSPIDETTGTSANSTTTPSTTATTMTSSTGTTGMTTIGTSTVSTDGEDDWVDGDFGNLPDIGVGCKGDCGPIDVLFVVDNSGSMAEEQLALARAAVGWVGRVLADGGSYDVQVMVTTTDYGNPLCTPFQPAGYEPSQGAPTSSGCNTRIDDFTGLGAIPVEADWACTSVCPSDLVPADPFVAFGPGGTNVLDVPEADVDGDGVPDSAVAQSLACLLPQGINGCGYESPLENMLQALSPAAEWNLGDRPFLREGARLAIVVVTDEADCSVQDYSVMEDEAYFNINPNNGTPQASSAICWNAGVSCNGPDAGGVYSDCVAVQDGPLQETSRYTQYLVGELVETQGKRVDFFAIAGVPEVSEYDVDPPYAPTAGGLLDLVVRNWQDGQYPAGDILPDEFAMGTTAANKTFNFGIGPACTGENRPGNYTGQALPNPRLFEVCQALDGREQHCFVDSVCASDYDGALGTLWGTMVVLFGD